MASDIRRQLVVLARRDGMSRCEVCETPHDLLTCGYDDQPMLAFCHEDMVDHLETAHASNDAAQRQAQEIRAALRKSERGLIAAGVVKTSPRPWVIHATGSHLGIKDAKGKFVFRKVVSQISIAEYNLLRSNFELIIYCLNKEKAN